MKINININTLCKLKGKQWRESVLMKQNFFDATLQLHYCTRIYFSVVVTILKLTKNTKLVAILIIEILTN
jgi:hypothetical protein